MANSITIVGNLTADPELRFTENGTAVVSFDVACNNRYRDNDGDWQENLNGFFRCQAWRHLAENVAEILRKGKRVVVNGTLRTRFYENEDGERRTFTYVECEDVAYSLMFVHRDKDIKKSSKSGRKNSKAKAPEPEDVPF